MNGIPVKRRTNVVPSLHTANQDVEAEFRNVDSRQREFVQSLQQLLASIFRNYKKNDFVNDRNVKLLSSFLLLQAITKKNGNFVKVVQQRKTELADKVSSIVEGLVDQEFGVGDIVNADTVQHAVGMPDHKAVVRDVTALMYHAIDEFAKENRA